MLELIPQRHYHFALEQHEKLIEVLSSFDNTLVRNINSNIERHYEERDEFITSVRAFVSKNVLKLRFEVPEELTDKFESQPWFQLLKELIAFLNPVLVLQSLCLDVDLNAIVQ